MTKKLTLKEARVQGKLAEFAKQHEDEVGDMDKFDATLSSMVQGKSPKVRKASVRDDSAN